MFFIRLTFPWLSVKFLFVQTRTKGSNSWGVWFAESPLLPREVQHYGGGNEECRMQLAHKQHYTIRKLSAACQGVQGMIQSLRNKRRISSSQLRSLTKSCYTSRVCLARLPSLLTGLSFKLMALLPGVLFHAQPLISFQRKEGRKKKDNWKRIGKYFA